LKAPHDNGIAYEIIRSRRSTADIIIDRDGSVLVRAPEWADDDQVANIVESKHYWIYQGLAEWRDLRRRQRIARRAAQAQALNATAG